ncbi:MAG TPA: hypothetical protein VKA60_23475 [Blastocatellia bacterium]|nr:hypothetical protein [Blastocatellia bacterium]
MNDVSNQTQGESVYIKGSIGEEMGLLVLNPTMYLTARQQYACEVIVSKILQGPATKVSGHSADALATLVTLADEMPTTDALAALLGYVRVRIALEISALGTKEAAKLRKRWPSLRGRDRTSLVAWHEKHLNDRPTRLIDLLSARHYLNDRIEQLRATGQLPKVKPTDDTEAALCALLDSIYPTRWRKAEDKLATIIEDANRDPDTATRLVAMIADLRDSLTKPKQETLEPPPAPKEEAARRVLPVYTTRSGEQWIDVIMPTGEDAQQFSVEMSEPGEDGELRMAVNLKPTDGGTLIEIKRFEPKGTAIPDQTFTIRHGEDSAISAERAAEITLAVTTLMNGPLPSRLSNEIEAVLSDFADGPSVADMNRNPELLGLWLPAVLQEGGQS